LFGSFPRKGPPNGAFLFISCLASSQLLRYDTDIRICHLSWLGYPEDSSIPCRTEDSRAGISIVPMLRLRYYSGECVRHGWSVRLWLAYNTRPGLNPSCYAFWNPVGFVTLSVDYILSQNRIVYLSACFGRQTK
jgi:hypothetical protein